MIHLLMTQERGRSFLSTNPTGTRNTENYFRKLLFFSEVFNGFGFDPGQNWIWVTLSFLGLVPPHAKGVLER